MLDVAQTVGEMPSRSKCGWLRGSFTRAIGPAIVQEAAQQGADLIVLGSSPRWRRQSRFFSPTVDYVLKKAPSEVLIVAFPQGVLEGDGELR